MNASFHRLVDDGVARALGAALLYKGGFGDRRTLEDIVAAIASYTRDRPIGDVEMRWSRSRRVGPWEMRSGTFVSPSTQPLPRESRTAHVELLSPRRGGSGGMCLALAATSEEGFGRRRFFARRLLDAGISVLLLENAFYGVRRPEGQRGSALRTVVEQFAMNTATVDEARALLAWIRGEGFVPGVTGYSQGGFMAAFAASLVDFPVVAVPRGVGTSAAPVFTGAALGRSIAWGELARELGTTPEGARQELARHLRAVDLTHVPAPVATDLATVLVARHDRFVPPADGEALHRHWKGSRLVWSEAGHVTSLFLDGAAHARVVIDAFARANPTNASSPVRH